MSLLHVLQHRLHVPRCEAKTELETFRSFSGAGLKVFLLGFEVWDFRVSGSDTPSMLKRILPRQSLRPEAKTTSLWKVPPRIFFGGGKLHYTSSYYSLFRPTSYFLILLSIPTLYFLILLPIPTPILLASAVSSLAVATTPWIAPGNLTQVSQDGDFLSRVWGLRFRVWGLVFRI